MESNLINCTTSVGSGHNWTCFVVHYEAEVTTAAALNMSRFGELGLDEYPLLTAYDPAYELRYGLLGTVLLSVAYTLIFIVGLLGNISVVIVVKKSSMMRSPTNRFIVNLAYADLLVNFLCLPFTLIGNLFPAWILGVFFCKTVSYMQGVSVSASVNTLMAISIERCVAISFPISGTITTRQYRVIVTIIWTIALSINLPWLFVFTLKPIGIPGSSAQVIKMVFVVIVTFTLSWLPLYAIFCFVKFAGDLIYDESVQSLIFGILPVAQWLGAANSCINPVLYAFMNRKFRAGFSHLFRTCCTADDDDWDLRTTVRSDETREQALRRIRSEKLSIRNGGHTGFGSVHVTGPMRYSQSTRLPQIHRVD
ncbi:neuropeptide SIFamide receptor-like isoform X2 [Toxorhynchites rutilus septentrionalis]|uniref:neuropeptide SIFamide receptor-like isoform X2 n=1 Tax=Toxorhynchites rutilus septentrionalis TaxID=329112 RepID=UPI002478F78D|nr:neuropeptide SIFamide receptor-like isoform X2 [Toxorhynchites rutilus septentrionalis]